MNAGALGPSLPSSPLGAWTPVSLSLGAGRPPEVSFLVLPCSGEGHGAIGSVEFWREISFFCLKRSKGPDPEKYDHIMALGTCL